MIVISDCSKNIVIPAGLGDNAGVVYETAGVKSLNGETGDVKIKTVNGQSLMGEGDVPVDVGVETLNGQKGALTLKTVNGNELTGDGNIEIKAGVESVNGKTGAVEVQDLGEYAICALQMMDITLSEEDTDVLLYNYGAGYDNGGWSRYMSGDRTLQILLIGTKDRKGYKVPVEIHLMHDNQENAEMHFTIGDYRYVYSQVSNMHWRFTSKTPVNGETGNVKSLKYFDLATDNSKEAYEEIANHWDDQKGYTGDFIFRYKKGQSDFTFDEIGYLKGHSVFFSYLNNVGAYDLTGDIKCFSIIIWYEDGKCSLSTYENDYTFPKKVSQLTNDSGFQTKAEVDTAIENALGGGGSTGSDDVIVLDGLSQEERKAIHDKLDLTKPLTKPFMYESKISVYAWDSGGGNVKFLTFEDRYDGIQVKRYNFAPDGWLGEDNRGHTYTNSVLMHLGSHVDESGYFECMYIGNFFEYILRPYTRPNACFINLEKGIGDSTRPIYAPVSTLVEKYGDTNNVRMQFIANEKLYTFLLDTNQENRWHFESVKPIGGVQSSEVSNIKVLTQSEYDTLTPKDENVLYCIKG